MLPEPNKKDGGGESPSYLAHPLQIFYYGYQWYYKAPKPELKTTGDAYSVRLWFYVLLIPVLWWFGINFLPFLLFLPYLAMGMGVDNAVNFGSSLSLILSFFIILRIYSFCTNNRVLPFSLLILSDYDSRIVPHLFGWSKEKNTLSLTGIGMFFDFAIGWSILYLMSLFMGLSFENDVLVGTMSSDLLFFISVFLLIAVFTPIVEELLFRGLVLDLLSENYGKWISILVSSVIFGFLHIHPISIFNAFCGGMIYGYLRIRTDSLWPSIILHALWNGHLVVLEFFYW
tara:strand:- start:4 stop:861 length:858 start_codon:yes stop_codon:yes gene_type:complete